MAHATRLVEWGTAFLVRDQVEAEMRARFDLACAVLAQVLPEGHLARPAPALHLWLDLPRGRRRAWVVADLYARSVAVVPSDAFALGPVPEAIRLSLGAPRTRAALERALTIVADALADGSFTSETTFV